MADNLTLDRIDMKQKSTAHLRIYVGALSDNTTVEELYDYFIQYGKIDGIIVNRNFGFVQFAEESSAQDAIKKANGSVFKGKNIPVRAATDKRRDVETVTIYPEVPPAVALKDTQMEDESEEAYDNYGNNNDHGFQEEFEEGNNRPEIHDERGRGRGRGLGPRGKGIRGARSRGPSFCDRPPINTSGEWVDRSGYNRFPKPPEYPRTLPVPERNDCEIIVVAKSLTEYAEYIENRLKRLGIVVDLLFPMEDVPIGKVLGNIASRGCLYAILVMPMNLEHRSLTLTILHGLPQEHRNMPIEDALQLLSRNFQEVQRGGPSGREAVYALLGQLADGRSLTVLQYNKVIEYLQERRDHQVKLELGESSTAPVTATTNKTQVELQQRIMNILNDKNVQTPPPAPVVAPAPVNTTTATTTAQNKLLNDPSLRKALDSILQKIT